MKQIARYIKRQFKRLSAIRYGTQSTSMNTEPINISEQMPPKDTRLKGTLHQTCQTLIYDTFIQIMQTGDLQLLVIEGNPKESELRDAWEKIMQEYSDLVKTEKSNTIFEAYKKLFFVSWKIIYVQRAVDFLKREYDEQIALQLCEHGYDYIQDLPDRTAYLHQIYLIETEAKMLIVLQNQYIIEYKRVAPPEESKSVTHTAIEYEKELAILSKFMGSRINKKEITVMEFAAIINIYIENNKQLEAANGKSRL